MAAHRSDFFDRFGISFCIDGPQMEYFVYQKQTGLDISCSLTLSFDAVAGQVDVMTFYPGLYLHPQTHYFSAVCFFMVIHHFAQFHHVERDCQILLNTRIEVFDTFYSLLKDFDFHLLVNGKKDRVDIQGRCLSLVIDTSMFKERALEYSYLDK